MMAALHNWKRVIYVALGVLLLADAALLYQQWRSGGGGPRAMQEQRDELRAQEKLLGADVRRVRAIRDRLPEVRRQCDEFFARQFLQSRGGYSTVVADLSEIAEKAGLEATSVTFKERALDKRGVTEVAISATVEGSYSDLVKFINGIERSENFYLLDSLSLTSAAGGEIKLTLALRTYFRAAPEQRSGAPSGSANGPAGGAGPGGSGQ